MPTVRVTDEIRDFFGHPVMGLLGPLTLREVILEALNLPKAGDENLSWTERRAIFELADEVARQEEVATTGADLVLVMSRLPPGTSNLVLGRVSEAMDNRAEIAVAEAEAIRLQDLRLAQETGAAASETNEPQPAGS